ncbi:class II fructose-1,6-bisphosphate aldolase [Oceanobacillus longus]|uniref:Class II fructose-1,6-bisphosphate aldolase n=1 Tax=Oceanobacillus longus TaxID=930120 RepID=A0ABV8H2Y5_9BACI
MQLVSVRDMLKKALDGGYAIGHFDVHNLEWIQAVLEAAKEEKSPVILGVTEEAVRYLGGYSVAGAIIKSLMKEMNITVPVALHLDHGQSVESCKSAIDNGFTSVMIDGSHFPFEQNMKMTKEVVDYAHPKGVTVEAELGSIGGQEGILKSEGPVYADLNECIELVKHAKIDSLTPALGTAHGPYKGEPVIGFDKMEEISNSVKIPLVMHGGSGLPPEQIKKSIALGTAKINVNADNHLAFSKTVREELNQNKELYVASDYLAKGRSSVKETVIGKLRLFGSSGKAIK